MSPAPVRTCIGCRTARPNDELIRLALDHDNMVIGAQGHGRGAWICGNDTCVQAAVKARAFSRAFRSKLADRAEGDRLICWLRERPH